VLEKPETQIFHFESVAQHFSGSHTLAEILI